MYCIEQNCFALQESCYVLHSLEKQDSSQMVQGLYAGGRIPDRPRTDSLFFQTGPQLDGRPQVCRPGKPHP